MVLSAKSDFFKHVFTSNLKEGQAGHEVTLDVTNADLFEKIIPYFYGQQIEIEDHELFEIFLFADLT